MCCHHLKTVDQGQTWIRGVVQDSRRWMTTVEARTTVRVMSWTIDTINCRTILVFISNHFFSELVYLIHVKKVHTYLEIHHDELTLLHCSTTYCIHVLQYTWKYYVQNSVVRISFEITISQNWYDCFM